MHLPSFILPLLLPTLRLASATPHTSPSCPYPNNNHIFIRLPPWFNTSSSSAHITSTPWTPPPSGWFFKPWFEILASNPQYTAFRNLQYDPTPLDPSAPEGLVQDLFSFQLAPSANNSSKDTTKIYTTYGIDTPDAQQQGVYYYNATGIIAGATGTFAILAWGCDRNGNPWYASYATETALTKTPAGVDILSTCEEGMDARTREEVVKGLVELESEEIRRLVGELREVVQDGGRRGLGKVKCDAYCKTNADLLGLLG